MGLQKIWKSKYWLSKNFRKSIRASKKLELEIIAEIFLTKKRFYF